MNPVCQRSSNLELYRIVVMLAIIAHHYVVNSGLLAVLETGAPSFISGFLLCFGAWGKVGINCFVLITGYFMCEREISLKKFLRLYLEMVFYSLVINLAFWLSGYSTVSAKELFYTFFQVRGITTDYFGGAFLVFFLTIPFLNILVRHMSRMQHRLLLALLIPVYTILPFFPGIAFSYNHVEWFAILYFVSSYIRKYPSAYVDDVRLWGYASLAVLSFGLASVIVMAYAVPPVIANRSLGPYYWLSDSNKFSALLCSVCFFLFFKNLHIGSSRAINTVASSCFGVFLIHTNSDVMRHFLWRNLCDNIGWVNSEFCVLHAIGCVMVVFAVCATLDLLRQKLVEGPLLYVFSQWFKKYNGD